MACAHQRVPPPTAAALETLVCAISERVGRALECQGLLVRDLEDPFLTLDSPDESGFDALLGHSITYRIALGPHQDRKAFTLQTVAAAALSADTLARAAGFSLHAGVASAAHERAKLARLGRYYTPGGRHRALVAHRSGQCPLLTQDAVPGWHHGRDVRACRLDGALGGAGADAARQPHALPRRLGAEPSTAGADHPVSPWPTSP